MIYTVTYEEITERDTNTTLAFESSDTNESKELALTLTKGIVYFCVIHTKEKGKNTEYFKKLRKAIEEYNKI